MHATSRAQPAPRFSFLAAALAVLALAFAAPAAAQPRGTPEPGFDYRVLKPEQPTESPGRIEVIDFFWYGCPHCYNLLPLFDEWKKKLPADVVVRRVPAVLSEAWVPHARAYYALEALGEAERLHRPLFDWIHRDRNRLENSEALLAWLAKQGVDGKKFTEAANSFGVQSKVRRAMQMAAAYRVSGVPMIAVQGRYTVSAENADGRREHMMATTDYLVGLSRRELKR